MDTNTPNVAGRAVYLELTKGSMTTQILLMPEGRTPAMALTPMTLYRRRLIGASTRKNWKQLAAMNTAASRASTGADVSADVLSFADPVFSGLAINGWKLYKEPIVVEVTAEDIEDSRMSKTPYKVLGRVWKVRKALGFPKEFIHAPASLR